MATTQTATTQYITASNGTKYAYRHIGITNGIPLVMHIHFRANMDFWDPLFINTLAVQRPVIIFDQPGTGRTPGTIPTDFSGWVEDLLTFVDALEFQKIDLFGFSLGGVAVQYAAITRPCLIRKLILAGTRATDPSVDFVPGVVWPRRPRSLTEFGLLVNASTIEQAKHALASSFFYHDAIGRAAFDSYWQRLFERKVEPLILELLDREGSALRQVDASRDTLEPYSSFDRFGELKMPVLVANGDRDLLIPSSRSWKLYTQIGHAQLIMYPKAGHGFLWQYAELFAGDINRFLDSKEYDNLA